MNRIARKQAISIGEALKEMFKSGHATFSHNTRRVFEAWNVASGAGACTIRRFFRDGVLYVTVNSSVVGMQLRMQKSYYIQKMNALLADDPLFISEESHPEVVKDIIIK